MKDKRKERNLELVDVVDRVLDKGIVVDASVGVDLLGIGLRVIDIDARVIVASLDTYMLYTKLPSSTDSQKRMLSSAPESRPSTAAVRVNKEIKPKQRSILALNATDQIRAHGLGIRLDPDHRSNRRSSRKAR